MKQFQWHYDESEQIYFAVAGYMSAQVCVMPETIMLNISAVNLDAPILVLSEYFPSAEEAKEYGLVDEIIKTKK